MIYLINGDEPYLIEDKLNEIIRKNKDALVSKVDGSSSDFNIDNLVNDCRSVGLFGDKQLILVKDPFFLAKKIDDKCLDNLLDYCHKPVYETDLVFYTLDNSFNERLKCFKDIGSNADVIKLNKLSRNEFFNYARKVIKQSNLNITKEAADALVNNANYDISLLNRNIEVLSLYPEKIDYDALIKLISFSSEEDVFNMINALTSKKASLAIKYANKLMANDESILRLISTLANQLRFLYTVGYYKSLDRSTKDIMDIVNTKSSYRIEKAYETLNLIDMNDIENLLSKLADLDYKCKKDSDIQDKLKLELFIVSLLG